MIGRKEIEFSVFARRGVKRDELKAELCKKLNISPASTIIVRIDSGFGSKMSTGIAHSYANEETLKKYESRRLLERLGVVQKEAKAAPPLPGGEAGGEEIGCEHGRRKEGRHRPRRKRRRSSPTRRPRRGAPSAPPGWGPQQQVLLRQVRLLRVQEAGKEVADGHGKRQREALCAQIPLLLRDRRILLALAAVTHLGRRPALSTPTRQHRIHRLFSLLLSFLVVSYLLHKGKKPKGS